MQRSQIWETYPAYTGHIIRILAYSLSKERHTFVYWNVSCLPVNVASMDWGVVSIWHIPGAEHEASQECSWLERSINNVPEREITDKPAKMTLVRGHAM